MNYLEHNLSLLKKYNPQAAEAIHKAPDNGVKLIQENGATKLLCINQDGREFPYYAEQTVEQSIQEIRDANFHNPRVLIFLGFGLGVHILEYLKKPHALTKKIIIVEPFLPVIKKAFENSDLSPLFKNNVQFAASSDPHLLSRFFGQIFSDNTVLSLANAIDYFSLKAAEKLTPTLFKEIPSLVAKSIAHQFNRQFGDPFDGYLGTEHFLQNLKLFPNMPAIDTAKELFKNRPGMVIASGPSLVHVLPYLKSVQDNVVMAVCPSALPAVLKAGIKPHIWLNIERLKNQGDFLTNLPIKPDHVFVAPWLVHSSCFQGSGGTNAYILGNSLQSNWLNSPYPAVDLGHSSAHAAFLILQRLSCSKIYLVGQDLCYYKDKTHAEGTWDESAKVMQYVDKQTEKMLQVPGNSGESVSINLFWHTYLKTFTEKIIPEYQGQVYHVIPQDMGAMIHGTTRINPAELTTQLKEPFDILNPLKKKLQEAPLEAWQGTIQKRLKQVQGMLMRLAQDSEAIAIACKKFQFSDQITSGDKEKIKSVYDDFMKQVMSYSTRYRTNTALAEQRNDYEQFFHCIVQGLFLRYRIEYFGKPGEEKYDAHELKRKAEILFHMSKDEAFWANAVYDLIEQNT